MKTNAISPNLKLEILSFTYVQSLYHDLQFNIRYAKFYKEVEMDKAKNNIVNLIAYERKALRLLVLGL